jgi:arsenate reductase
MTDLQLDPPPGRPRPIRVLFVCTGNSARSQLAEALLRTLGEGAFEAYSAGTEPRGVHPLTVRALADVGIDIGAARSKSVDEFLGRSFDYVVTVCDRARESCPVFPGAENTLHWGFDDPAAATGTEEERLAVFRRVMEQIAGRVRLFIAVALHERAMAAPVDAGA